MHTTGPTRQTTLALALVLAGCSSDGVCTSVAVGTGAGSTIDFGQCWDGQDRSVECTPATPAGRHRCECSVAGNAGATFERTELLVTSVSPTAEELAPINAGCGWNLRPR